MAPPLSKVVTFDLRSDRFSGRIVVAKHTICPGPAGHEPALRGGFLVSRLRVSSNQPRCIRPSRAGEVNSGVAFDLPWSSSTTRLRLS